MKAGPIKDFTNFSVNYLRKDPLKKMDPNSLKRVVGTILFLFFSIAGFSQSSTAKLKAKENALPQEGTYQIILENKKVHANISNEDLKKIEGLRKNEEVEYMEIDQYRKIKILPLNTIRAEGFTPREKIIYENEE